MSHWFKKALLKVNIVNDIAITHGEIITVRKRAFHYHLYMLYIFNKV